MIYSVHEIDFLLHSRTNLSIVLFFYNLLDGFVDAYNMNLFISISYS